MAAPRFVDAGTGATDAGGAWSYTCQASAAAGNVFIVQILQDGGTSGAVAVTGSSNINNLAGSSGWTTIAADEGATTIAYHHLYIGRATSTSAPTISGTNSTSEDLYIRSYQFTDVSTGTTLATVIENGAATSNYDVGTNTTVSDRSVVTNGPLRLALSLVAVNDDNALGVFTGETGGYWTEAVAEYAESSGTDGALQLQIDQAWKTTHEGSFVGIAYGDLYYCTVGGGGALAYRSTTPAGTWANNNQGTNPFYAVAYGNGYWVAVGTNATLDLGVLYYVALAPDGAWTNNNQGTQVLTGVAYGNGYWVAVGRYGTIYYKASTPSGSWSLTDTGDNWFRGVAYGNGYWVAVSDTGNSYYATDPTGTWTGFAVGGSGVAYGNGYWVAGQGSGNIAYTTDPTGTWTQTKVGGTETFSGVAYGNGYWVVSSTDGSAYWALSPFGEWTRSRLYLSSADAVTYGNGYWVIASAASGVLYTTDPSASAQAGTIDGGSTTMAASDTWIVHGFALLPGDTTLPKTKTVRQAVNRASSF